LSTLPATAVPALVEELGARGPAIRALAVDALARMRTSSATEHVAAALMDADAGVRSTAVNAFGRLGSSGIADAIVRISLEDPDASVRRRASVVCRRYGWSGARRGAGAR
jgi:HEAT repeat protein